MSQQTQLVRLRGSVRVVSPGAGWGFIDSGDVSYFFHVGDVKSWLPDNGRRKRIGWLHHREVEFVPEAAAQGKSPVAREIEVIP